MFINIIEVCCYVYMLYLIYVSISSVYGVNIKMLFFEYDGVNYLL